MFLIPDMEDDFFLQFYKKLKRYKVTYLYTYKYKMGLSSYPLFSIPANIMFLQKTPNIESVYGSYITDTIIPDLQISTGDFMQKIIDEYCHGIRVYGYLLKAHVKLWKWFLTDILEQNPKENKIEFHFYCREIGKAYYFRVVRKQDKILFSIMIGLENDSAYHNFSIKDEDENEYSFDEIEEMNRPDAMKGLLKNGDDEDVEENIYAEYEFDEKKYRIIYKIQNINFTENDPNILINY